MNFSDRSESPTILIVDDEKMMRILLRRALEKEGYRVVEATDGREAIDAYQRINPDLVLLDAVMPIMDGFTCCAELLSLQKKDSQKILHSKDEERYYFPWGIRSHSTPVLIVTGLEDAESVDRAFDVGAVDYITKPIHWAVLLQRVRRSIEQARLYKQLEAVNQELRRIACLDGLTQISNRRGFDETLDREWRRMARERSSLSLILCDVDFFKAFNDSFGHLAGDICLQRVAEAIRNVAKRPADLVARYGGEEFAAILPSTSDDGAIYLAEEIRAKVAALEIPHPKSEVSKYITVSLGVASIVPLPDSEPRMLIDAADKALYQAKASGRDRVIFSSS